MELAVGDRVMAIVDHPGYNDYIKVGCLGTVRVIKRSNDRSAVRHYGVGWDEYCDGGSLGGVIDCGFGWYVRPSEITSVEDDGKNVPEISSDKLFEFLEDT